MYDAGHQAMRTHKFRSLSSPARGFKLYFRLFPFTEGFARMVTSTDTEYIPRQIRFPCLVLNTIEVTYLTAY